MATRILYLTLSILSFLTVSGQQISVPANWKSGEEKVISISASLISNNIFIFNPGKSKASPIESGSQGISSIIKEGESYKITISGEDIVLAIKTNSFLTGKYQFQFLREDGSVISKNDISIIRNDNGGGQTTTKEPEKDIKDPVQPNENKEPVCFARRSVEKIENGKFKVIISLNSTSINKFSTLKEVIPEGFTHSNVQTEDGEIQSSTDELKIIWSAFPGIRKISYELSSSSNNDDPKVKGEFKTEDCFAGVEEISGDEDIPILPEPIIVGGPGNYRVQLAASHFRVSQQFFSNRYGFKDKFIIEEDLGWLKYVTEQSFATLEEAIRKKVEVSALPLKKPFVVEYGDGKRKPLYYTINSK